MPSPRFSRKSTACSATREAASPLHALRRRLEWFPESGRALPEFPDLPYREVIVAPYGFFYRIADRTVWIAGVWHGAQIPEEPRRGG